MDRPASIGSAYSTSDSPAALRGDVDQRRQHEDADVEEHGDAEDQAGEPHREGRPASGRTARSSRECSDVRATRPLQDRAEHGAETDDRGDVAEDAAEARLQEGSRTT